VLVTTTNTTFQYKIEKTNDPQTEEKYREKIISKKEEGLT
jgi:hypothetical protein